MKIKFHRFGVYLTTGMVCGKYAHVTRKTYGIGGRPQFSNEGYFYFRKTISSKVIGLSLWRKFLCSIWSLSESFTNFVNGHPFTFNKQSISKYEIVEKPDYKKSGYPGAFESIINNVMNARRHNFSVWSHIFQVWKMEELFCDLKHPSLLDDTMTFDKPTSEYLEYVRTNNLNDGWISTVKSIKISADENSSFPLNW